MQSQHEFITLKTQQRVMMNGWICSFKGNYNLKNKQLRQWVMFNTANQLITSSEFPTLRATVSLLFDVLWRPKRFIINFSYITPWTRHISCFKWDELMLLQLPGNETQGQTSSLAINEVLLMLVASEQRWWGDVESILGNETAASADNYQAAATTLMSQGILHSQ